MADAVTFRTCLAEGVTAFIREFSFDIMSHKYDPNGTKENFLYELK